MNQINWPDLSDAHFQQHSIFVPKHSRSGTFRVNQKHLGLPWDVSSDKILLLKDFITMIKLGKHL